MEIILIGLLAPFALVVTGVLIAGLALSLGFLHAGVLILTGHKP